MLLSRFVPNHPLCYFAGFVRIIHAYPTLVISLANRRVWIDTSFVTDRKWPSERFTYLAGYCFVFVLVCYYGG